MFKQHPRRLYISYIGSSPDGDTQNQTDYISIAQIRKQARRIVARIQEQTATQIISCLWRCGKSGWLNDKDSTAFRL